jgi:hypothetical protein
LLAESLAESLAERLTEVRMEDRIARMLAIARRIVEEGREPTDEERALFRELEGKVQAQPAEWKERWSDLVDRLAAALEGIGL